MHLLIDVGNTRLKWLLVRSEFSDDLPITTGSLFDLKKFFTTIDVGNVEVNIAAVNLSSELDVMLNESGFKSLTIAKTMAKQNGVYNSYLQPERMGVDRWLAMIAGYRYARNANKQGVVVIDAGSALTIDVVDPTGHHLGGLIVPGVQMAQQALFTNTERVVQYKEEIPTSDNGFKVDKLGNNTVECVEYGVVRQLCSMIQSTAEQYPSYDIILTGGDAELLLACLDSGCTGRIKMENNLVLKGLWQVRN